MLRALTTTLVVTVAITSGPLARSADVTATWDNSTGDWSDATRWDTDPLFPDNGNGGNTFDAVITSGTATR